MLLHVSGFLLDVLTQSFQVFEFIVAALLYIQSQCMHTRTHTFMDFKSNDIALFLFRLM